MAKKKKQGMAKKPSEVESTAEKLLGNPSPSELGSKAKKSTAKNPSEVESTAEKLTGNPTPAELGSKAKKMKMKIPPPESSSEEDEETCKDSGKNPVTPSASVQSSDSESKSKGESEADTESETASAAANKKRQSEEAALVEVNEPKRSKTETEKTTGLFQRIWSEEDELVLLQGIIDFRNNTGKSHSDDLNGFFESIKDSLSMEVKSVNKCSIKIWTLKRKYVGKMKIGVEPSLRNPHEQRCLELAKVIWATDVDKKSKKKMMEVGDGSSKNDDAAERFEKSFLVGSMTNLGVFGDEADVREKWKLVPVKEKEMIMKKWKSFKAIELKSVLLKTDLVNVVSHAIAKYD